MTIPTYRSAKATDGTWTIFRVPIFAAHEKFDAKWLHAALAKAKTRQAEGYMAPLHVGHHVADEAVDAAGKFRMTEIGTVMHGGKPVQAIFADLVGVTAASYAKIRKGELSYRSVEILDVATPEIDSLALLDDEVPFFRFPLLRVAEDTPATVQLSAPGTTPVLAFSARGQSIKSLLRFEDTMPEDTPKVPEDGDAPEEDAEKKGAIEEGLKAIMEILQGLMGGEEDAGNAGPAEQPAPSLTAGAEATPVGVAAQGSLFAAAPAVAPVDLGAAGEQAAIMGRLKSMEAKYAAMVTEKAIDTQSAALSAKGYSNEQVQAFRGAAAKHGLVAAQSFAAGMDRAGGPGDPPTHWTGELHAEAPDPPAVAKFAANGPEALAEARDLYGSWERTKSDLSFSDYHNANTQGVEWVGTAG